MRGMGWLVAAIAVGSGCSGDGLLPSDTPTGQLLLAIAAEVPKVTDDDSLDLQQLELSVDTLLIDDVSPSGAASVAVLVDEVFQPLESVDAIGVQLQAGDHTDFTFEMQLARPAQPAILAVAETGDDGEQITLAVDRIALAFVAPLVEISEETPRMARIVFRPEAWFAGILVDDDGATRIDSTSGQDYDALLDRIASSTVLMLEGEDLAPTAPGDTGTGDDDDDDDDDGADG